MALSVIQFGLNTCDMGLTLRLYAEAFGFRNGGSQLLYGETIKVQGLPSDSLAVMWYLVGGQKRFQLELFQHSHPTPRPLPFNWSVADLGWTRFGVAVADFDRTMAVLGTFDIRLLAGVHIIGGKRRAAIRDPYVGIVIDVMEGDDGAEFPKIIYAAASVSDLDSARDFYANVLGLPIATDHDLHPVGSDAIWAIEGAQSSSFVADGGSVRLVFVEYIRPQGRPRRPDYRSSDLGFINVALGAETKEPVAAAMQRAIATGLIPPHIVESEDLLAGYITDAEREVELAVIPTAFEGPLGFLPAVPFFGQSL